jgi:hypothetical protein
MLTSVKGIYEKAKSLCWSSLLLLKSRMYLLLF